MADPLGNVGWYLPERRAVFLPGDAHISHSVARLLRSGRFETAIDRNFPSVIRACASRDETWISGEIERVYLALYERGLAHSIEVYQSGTLIGGLYGVALDGAFFGESMFHVVTDASKLAFAVLCRRLDQRGYLLHDAQFMTPHLARLGAREISKSAYLKLLNAARTLRCRFL